MAYNETPTKGNVMQKPDRFNVNYFLISFTLSASVLAYAAYMCIKAETTQKAEHGAAFYAMSEVCKLLNEGSIKTQEDVDREFQFAYMNYRAHN